MGKPKILRVPEARIGWFLSQGYVVLGRDSEVPIELGPGQWFDKDLWQPIRVQQPNANDADHEGDAA